MPFGGPKFRCCPPMGGPWYMGMGGIIPGIMLGPEVGGPLMPSPGIPLKAYGGCPDLPWLFNGDKGAEG